MLCLHQIIKYEFHVNFLHAKRRNYNLNLKPDARWKHKASLVIQMSTVNTQKDRILMCLPPAT